MRLCKAFAASVDHCSSEDMADKVSLKWEDFQSSVRKSFSSLRNEQDLFDVTLVSDDEVQISAHKLILTACSPFFKKILKNYPHNHPLLYLGGISSMDLLHMMDYIYNGEVTVHQQELDKFMMVSQKFQLEGLVKDGSRPIPTLPDIDFTQFDPQAFKLPSGATSSALALEACFTQQPQIKLEDTRDLDFLSNSSDVNQASGVATVYSFKDMDQVDKQLEEFSEKINGVYTCKICLKTFASRTNNHYHIETHMDGLLFSCDKCDRTTKTRNALKKHYGFYHKFAPFQVGQMSM